PGSHAVAHRTSDTGAPGTRGFRVLGWKRGCLVTRAPLPCQKRSLFGDKAVTRRWFWGFSFVFNPGEFLAGVGRPIRKVNFNEANNLPVAALENLPRIAAKKTRNQSSFALIRGYQFWPWISGRARSRRVAF